MIAIYALIILIGGYLGIWLEKLSVYLINKRVTEPIVHRFSGSNKNTVMWVLLNSLGWLTSIGIGGLSLKTTEFIIIFSVCLVVTAVDITIRKIPNEAILFILIIHTIFIALSNQFSSINTNIVGFVLGFVMFFIPTLIGKGAGFGDVKFAAATGFCLGLYDFLTAIVIMSLVLVIYTIYIMIAGKGNLKTKIALAPFMASGLISVLLINIINNKFNLETLLNLMTK